MDQQILHNQTCYPSTSVHLNVFQLWPLILRALRQPGTFAFVLGSRGPIAVATALRPNPSRPYLISSPDRGVQLHLPSPEPGRRSFASSVPQLRCAVFLLVLPELH